MVGTPKIEPDSPNSAHEKELSVDAKLQRQALAISRAERESILGLLPNYIKENFGNIGYGKFEGEWFPVVLVSPFNFPASAPIRKTWQKHFDEVSYYHTAQGRKVRFPTNAYISHVLDSVSKRIQNSSTWRGGSGRLP